MQASLITSPLSSFFLDPNQQRRSRILQMKRACEIAESCFRQIPCLSSDTRMSFSHRHAFTGLLKKRYCALGPMKLVRAPRCSDIVSEITVQFPQALKIPRSRLFREFYFCRTNTQQTLNGSLCASEWMLLCFLLQFQEFLPPFARFFAPCRKRKRCTGTK